MEHEVLKKCSGETQNTARWL